MLIISRDMTDSLGFLISDISRLMRRRFDERARRIGATRAQWRTLKMLERHQGSNQGALAEMLEIEPITMGRMIDRLEEAGLVERRRDPADRRVWRIHLTEASRPVLRQLREIADELFDDVMIGLPAADRARLHDLLAAVHANLTTDEIKEAANG